MAKRRTKPIGELGEALDRRELELGLTREQAIERIKQFIDDGSLAGGTYYGWLRGVAPTPPFWIPLAQHLDLELRDLLGMLGELSQAKGVYTNSLVSIGSAA